MGCAVLLRIKTMASARTKLGSAPCYLQWQQMSLFEPPSEQELSRLEALQGKRSSTRQLKKLGVWLPGSSRPQKKHKRAPTVRECLARGLTRIHVKVAVNDSGHAIGEDHVGAKYLDSDVESALELRSQGYTLRQISQMLDMPIRTIRGYLDGSRRNQSIAGWRTFQRWQKKS